MIWEDNPHILPVCCRYEYELLTSHYIIQASNSWITWTVQP
jgi:hypothetical protein